MYVICVSSNVCFVTLGYAGKSQSESLKYSRIKNFVVLLIGEKFSLLKTEFEKNPVKSACSSKKRLFCLYESPIGQPELVFDCPNYSINLCVLYHCVRCTSSVWWFHFPQSGALAEGTSRPLSLKHNQA